MRFWLNQPLRDQAGDGDGSGGGNSTQTLDAAAIAKMVSDGVNAALNGYDKKLQAKLSKFGQPAAPKADEGDGENADDGATTKTKPQGGVDPEVAKLRKQLEQTNKRLADADAERQSEKAAVKAEKKDAAIRRELAKITFIDDEAFETAYARLDRDVKFTDDGQLVGGEDEMPLGKFVTERMKRLDFLVKARDVGGAGAANGGKQSAGDEVDIDSIKPGMKPEDIAKVKARLVSLYSQNNN